ncbi:MAG: hypothetical protein HQL82_14580 [Magnetococcales bacterium]|nr:hypothetical protein [Magnetococcales bacterium]
MTPFTNDPSITCTTGEDTCRSAADEGVSGPGPAPEPEIQAVEVEALHHGLLRALTDLADGAAALGKGLYRSVRSGLK